MNLLSPQTLRLLCFVTTTLAVGIHVAGCSGGSSGSSGSTAPASTSAGTVTSALPTPNRAASYSFSSTSAGNDPDASVDSLSIAPNGSDLLAISATRALLVTDTVLEEASLPASATTLATLGSAAFLGTTDGAGDVYQRTENNGTGSWALVNDTQFSELRLAAVDGELVALVGGTGQVGELLTLDPSDGTTSSTASLGSYVPTAAVRFQGSTWVGASATGSLQPGLLRVNSTAVEELAVPSAQLGVRQDVTGMLTVMDSNGTELLVFSVAGFDPTSGQAIAGAVLATADGLTFDVLLNLTQDAPTCLAWSDDTVYAGLASGRLLYRDANGGWPEEAGVPANTGISSLFSRDADTLAIGARDANGPLVLIRAASGARGGAAGTPATGGAGGGAVVDYLNSVKPALASCVTCHSTMQTGYTVSAGLADDMADYQATLAQVDVNNAPNSNLLLKGSGAVTHAGGGLWAAGSAEYAIVEAWIVGGAVYDGGANAQGPAAPAPLSANPTYLVDAKPVIASCAGCHANEDPRIGLVDDMADYMNVVDEVNLNNPANSSLLRRAIGQDHPVKVFDQGSQPYNVLLNWIEKGAAFQ